MSKLIPLPRSIFPFYTRVITLPAFTPQLQYHKQTFAERWHHVPKKPVESTIPFTKSDLFAKFVSKLVGTHPAKFNWQLTVEPFHAVVGGWYTIAILELEDEPTIHVPLWYMLQTMSLVFPLVTNRTWVLGSAIGDVLTSMFDHVQTEPHSPYRDNLFAWIKTEWSEVTFLRLFDTYGVHNMTKSNCNMIDYVQQLNPNDACILRIDGVLHNMHVTIANSDTFSIAREIDENEMEGVVQKIIAPTFSNHWADKNYVF